jgi:hypothetical protein
MGCKPFSIDCFVSRVSFASMNQSTMLFDVLARDFFVFAFSMLREW